MSKKKDGEQLPKMRYNVGFNQLALVTHFPSLDYKHGLMFDYIKGLCTSNSRKLQRRLIDNTFYVWMNYSTFKKQMPSLKIKSSGHIRPALDQMVEAGLIKIHEEPQKIFVALTEKADLMEFTRELENETDKKEEKSKTVPKSERLGTKESAKVKTVPKSERSNNDNRSQMGTDNTSTTLIKSPEVLKAISEFKPNPVLVQGYQMKGMTDADITIAMGTFLASAPSDPSITTVNDLHKRASGFLHTQFLRNQEEKARGKTNERIADARVDAYTSKIESNKQASAFRQENLDEHYATKNESKKQKRTQLDPRDYSNQSEWDAAIEQYPGAIFNQYDLKLAQQNWKENEAMKLEAEEKGITIKELVQQRLSRRSGIGAMAA